MLLLVGVFQKNAERVIGSFSALFIPEIGEREWLLSLLVRPRGLLGVVRFEDTW
jgi:hypothetical protein